MCSQNANRPGSKTARQWTGLSQFDFLAGRFLETGCDVIALQEVYGETRDEARRHLEHLAALLEAGGAGPFLATVGDTETETIRNGFLSSRLKLKVEQVRSLDDTFLDSLSLLSPPKRFSRPPLVIFARTKSEPPRQLLIINIHFKSQAGGWKDRSGTDFETLRMEMAEAVRSWAQREAKKIDKEAVVIILGDRNSERGSAADEVLQGARTISDVRSGCSVSKGKKIVCPLLNRARSVNFVGLIGRASNAASYRYKGKQSLLDEIYVRPQDLHLLATDAGGDPDAGVSGLFDRGSDHKLLWAAFNL